MKRAMNVAIVCLSAGLTIGIAAAQQDKAKPAPTQPTPTPAAQPATPPKPAAATPAQPATPAKPGAHAPAQPEMQLPPGWTPADMEAYAKAATPGEMHAFLNKNVGTWNGKVTMWMAPGLDPITSECTMTVTSLFDGKFIQANVNGEMPGMGPFHGMGLYGFDNVAQKFQASWVSNHGTGLMQGTGELSSDGSTITWTYTAHCPLQKKACTMREIEKVVNADTRTLTSYGPDPKTGKEFKMMEITFTRAKK